jgi:hypothetical protein
VSERPGTNGSPHSLQGRGSCFSRRARLFLAAFSSSRPGNARHTRPGRRLSTYPPRTLRLVPVRTVDPGAASRIELPDPPPARFRLVGDAEEGHGVAVFVDGAPSRVSRPCALLVPACTSATQRTPAPGQPCRPRDRRLSGSNRAAWPLRSAKEIPVAQGCSSDSNCHLGWTSMEALNRPAANCGAVTTRRRPSTGASWPSSGPIAPRAFRTAIRRTRPGRPVLRVYKRVPSSCVAARRFGRRCLRWRRSRVRIPSAAFGKPRICRPFCGRSQLSRRAVAGWRRGRSRRFRG